MAELKSIIIDDFYTDALDVRKLALGMEYEVSGNYPGRRTKPAYTQSTRALIQAAIQPLAGNITYWPDNYTGAFQYTTSRDRSWIHADDGTTWAGVIYLTPDAPLSGGTGLFRHKATGLERAPRNPDGTVNVALLKEINKDSQDMTKWEMTDRIANKFNRLILYRGDLFHMSLDYFGQGLEDGRLFQTFFFSTER